MTHIIFPGLHCYACPLSVTICPIGLMQNLVIYGTVPYFWIGTIIAYGLVLGRGFCGWFCPFGTLNDLLSFNKMRISRSFSYSKYAVLAVIVADAMAELDKLTHDFAPRESGESPSDFAKRMVGYAAIVFSSHDPIMSACNLARSTDAQIREIMDDFQDTVIDKIVGLVKDDSGTQPVSDNVAALVRFYVHTERTVRCG